MPTHGTPVATYTTDIARREWISMKIVDFLAKYHVSRKNAISALGTRPSHPHSGYDRNRKYLENLGMDKIRDMVGEFGMAHTARSIGIDKNAIRLHIQGKKRSGPSVKKYRQPGVGLI